MKTHKLIARQDFNRADGIVVKKGEIFQVPVRTFVRRGVEYYEFQFSGQEPTWVPCSHASFNVDVKDVTKKD